MNKDAFYRFLQQASKYTVYFGKSCIGKSTYLNKIKTKNINVDDFMWEVAYKIKPKDIVDNHKLNLKQILKGNNPNLFYEYLSNELNGNKIFWTTFFSEVDAKNISILDWASIGIYWDFISDYYKSQIKLIKLDCNKKFRIERIMDRADKRNLTIEQMSEHIQHLDNVYKEPNFFDEVIEIS